MVARGALAQSPIPLDTPITVKLFAQDTGTLRAYNLYDFSYQAGPDMFTSTFIVPKTADSIGHHNVLSIVVAQVREFMVIPPDENKGGIIMPVEEGIEVSNANEPDKKSYLNFDITQPETVLLLKAFTPVSIDE